MHASHRPSPSAGRLWVAGSRQRRSRRLALGAALGLLVASLALPTVAAPPAALAEDGPRTFTAAFELDEPGTAGTFDLTLRLENTSPRRGGGSGRELGSANVAIADVVGGPARLIDGQGEDIAVVELRDLGLRPQEGHDYPLQVAGACGAEVTFSVVAKQSNDFQGTGNDLTDQSDPEDLVVTLDCGLSPYLDGISSADCGQEVCTVNEQRNGHQLTATSSSAEGQLYAGFRGNDADDAAGINALAEAFAVACDNLVGERANAGEPFRLTGEVAQVEPVDLMSDGDVTVRLLIPRSEVNTDENRSADVFTICFLGDEKAFEGSGLVDLETETPFQDADAALGSPDLYGPVLLPLCEEAGGAAPCIENRQKVRADVELTVRIRASDPWMR
jgi:hypothetical protein